MEARANHDQDFEPEPFGQRGVLPYVWPTFVVLCTIGFFTSLFMGARSQSVWDSLSHRSASREVIVASVVGRLVVDVLPPSRFDPSSSVWTFDSRLFDSITDGWPDSWMKVIGIEWGHEGRQQFSGQIYGYWRLRIRWRTLAILYSIPVAFELVKRARRRFAERQIAKQAAAR